MRKPVVGRCRLCNGEGPLVDSHIIPNFHFKSLKESDGHFIVLSTNPARRELKRQKGITEHLLCPNCDNVRLSRYEDHLAKIIFGGYPLDGHVTGRIHTIKGYDYKKVKNGLLSILWRMSIAEHLYFSNVDLGTKHENRIAEIILNDSVISEEEYPVLLTAPFLDGTGLANATMQPDYTRADGNRIYRCLISGLLFTFFVGSAPLHSKYRPLILRSDQWPIIKAKVQEIPFLLDAFKRLGRANSTRESSQPQTS